MLFARNPSKCTHDAELEANNENRFAAQKSEVCVAHEIVHKLVYIRQVKYSKIASALKGTSGKA